MYVAPQNEHDPDTLNEVIETVYLRVFQLPRAFGTASTVRLTFSKRCSNKPSRNSLEVH